MRRRKITTGLAVLAAAALLATPQARADFVFDLGTPNTDISVYSGPFAQVDVSLTDSTHATVTFTSLTKNGNIYLMGDGGTVALQVNAGTFSWGASGANSGNGFTPGPYSLGQKSTEDGFGGFNLIIDSNDGFKNSADTVTVSLTDISGTWASANAVLTGNANGLLAGAHIFVTSSPAVQSNGALTTGYASTPEPTTMIAGALLLLPFGASTLRILRRNRTA